jgi:hypothetical protein
MMAKKALRQNSEQSVLDFPENMLQPTTQGPHIVKENVGGKVVRIEEINLHTDIIDKAYFRVIEV